jgi:hypothetical protein
MNLVREHDFQKIAGYSTPVFVDGLRKLWSLGERNKSWLWFYSYEHRQKGLVFTRATASKLLFARGMMVFSTFP